MTHLIALLQRRSTTVIVVTLGLVIRVIYLIRIASIPLQSDAASYVDMGVKLTSGQHFVPYWPPALPIYLATIVKLFGGNETVLRVSILPFYLALCYCLYRLTIALTAKVACANLALLPLAFAPSMICSSVETTTELPTAFLLTWIAALLVGLRAEKISTTAVWLGVAIGWLSLLRPSSLILLLIVPAFLLWKARKLAPTVITFVISTTLVFVWIGYIYQTTGRIVMINTANARNLYIGNNENTPLYRTWWMGSHHEQDAQGPSGSNHATGADGKANRQDEDKQYSKLAQAYISREPGLFALRTVNRICVFFAMDTYTGAYLIENYHLPRSAGLAIVGVDSLLYVLIALGAMLYYGTRAQRTDPVGEGQGRWHESGILCALMVLYAAPYFVAFSHPRYHFPVEPMMMAVSAAFVYPFLEGSSAEIRKMLRRRRVLLAGMCLLFLAVQIEFVIIIFRAGLA